MKKWLDYVENYTKGIFKSVHCCLQNTITGMRCVQYAASMDARYENTVVRKFAQRRSPSGPRYYGL
jgi:hypothetical protein